MLILDRYGQWLALYGTFEVAFILPLIVEIPINTTYQPSIAINDTILIFKPTKLYGQMLNLVQILLEFV